MTYTWQDAERARETFDPADYAEPVCHFCEEPGEGDCLCAEEDCTEQRQFGYEICSTHRSSAAREAQEALLGLSARAELGLCVLDPTSQGLLDDALDALRRVV